MRQYAFYDPAGKLEGIVSETSNGLVAESLESEGFKEFFEDLAAAENATTVRDAVKSGFSYARIQYLGDTEEEEEGTS